MRNILILALSSILWMSCSSIKKVKSGESQSAKAFQEELVEFYTNPKTTPLIDDEKTNFVGLSFFPIDKKYDIQAVFGPINDGSVVKFPTSAKKIKEFKEYGIALFKLDNQDVKLTIYQMYPLNEENKDHLFLPFTDLTTGETSYGAGRYLDLKLSDLNLEKGTIHLDFNKTYNPYCAYSIHYNCPIPPASNDISVAIEAGVSFKKKY